MQQKAAQPTTWEGLKIIHPHAAGLDIGSTEVWAAVSPDSTDEPVRRFGTYTPDLEALADWLKSCGVDTAAMEATGVYWLPVYEVLQARGFEVWVVNARHIKPVVDLLREAGIDLTPVYLTGSDQATQGERGELRLGKAVLVSRLQVLLQSERVHLPATAEAGILAQELLNYEIRVNENAAAQFGAFKVGSHDDLATALGLACWEEGGWAQGGVIRPVDVIEEADLGGYF